MVSGFFRLLSIENFKMWKRLSTKVMILLLVVIVAAAIGLVRFRQFQLHEDVMNPPKVSDNWKAELQQEIPGLKKQIQSIESGKDNQLQRADLNTLKSELAEAQYRLDHNIAQSTPYSTWSQITDFEQQAGYGPMIALMLIITCAAVVAGEFSEGTLKMMISRPYYRHEILSAKLLATLLYGFTLLVTVIAANFLMFAMLYGVHGLNAYEMLWTGSKVLYVPAVVKMLAFFGLDFLQVIFYLGIAFALSAITRSRSIATGFSLFLLLVGGQIAQLVGIYFSWGRYIPLALSSFTNFISGSVTIAGTTLGLALVTSGIYFVAVMCSGFVTFAKRDV